MSIDDEFLVAANLSEAEVKTELAIVLYQKGKLSMGKAARLAEMNRIAFQFLLASREIPINYGVEDFRQDLETLRRMDADLKHGHHQ